MSDFDISGFDGLDERLQEIAKHGPEKLEEFAQKEAELLRGDAVRNTPTDTGLLKNSWKQRSVEQGVSVVYNNTEYAADVEYGHRIKTKSGKWAKTASGKTKVVSGAKMLRRAHANAKRSLREHAKLFLKGLLK